MRVNVIISLLVVFSSGYKCGARQPLQQQAEETAKAAEICRMSGQEGIRSSIFTFNFPKNSKSLLFFKEPLHWKIQC